MVEKKLVVIKDRNKVLFCFGGDQYALAVRDGDALDAVGSLLVMLGERMLSDHSRSLEVGKDAVDLVSEVRRAVREEMASRPKTDGDRVRPDDALVRLKDIIGDRKAGIPALIPVSRASWYMGVRSGRYPKPVQLGGRSVAWRLRDIRALIDSLDETD